MAIEGIEKSLISTFSIYVTHSLVQVRYDISEYGYRRNQKKTLISTISIYVTHALVKVRHDISEHDYRRSHQEFSQDLKMTNMNF